MAKSATFDDLMEDPPPMPPPGFKTPPQLAPMPDCTPKVDWALAGWRILLVAVIVLTPLTYLGCSLLNGMHGWLLRARASIEARLNPPEEPVEVV